MLPRWFAAAAAALAGTVLAACTGVPADSPTTSRSGSSVPPTTPAVPATSAVARAPADLRCADGTRAISGAPTKASQWRLGLWGENWGRRQVEEGVSAGVPAFWKVFLYVSPDAAPSTTLRVVTPRSARLYYVPFVWWSSFGSEARTPALTLRDLRHGRQDITFGHCAGKVVGFPGGVQTLGAACVTLAVEAKGRPAERVSLALGSPC